jgi:ComF family protein
MVYKHIVDRLLPPHCLCCAGPCHASRRLCDDCIADLPWTGACCRQCGLPAAGNDRCGRCLAQPPAFDRCVTPLWYQFPVPSLLGRFKHQRRLAEGAALAGLLAAHVQRHVAADQRPDLLVPVPLHWWRQLRRGFNQAQLIAEDCGRKLGIAVDARLLHRRIATPSQQSLGRRQRRRNLQAAFEAGRPAAPVVRHVALIDDVVTTMATCDSAARVLKRLGVARVDVWALARTPEDT